MYIYVCVYIYIYIYICHFLQEAKPFTITTHGYQNMYALISLTRLSFETILAVPGGTVIEHPPANAESKKRGFDPWIGNMPWSRK